MTIRRNTLVILMLTGQLLLGGRVSAAPSQASEQATDDVIVSVSTPERDQLRLVSFIPIVFQGVVVGRLAVYDDTRTRRVTDYLELYNDFGELLALGWFDRFGIQRTAIDRGAYQGGTELEGVFIVLTDGDSI